MNTDYLLVDLLRGVIGTGSLLLAAMIMRLLYVRNRDATAYGVHPAMYWSFALSLVVLAALRLTHVDQPPTWDLWPTGLAVILGWYAILKRTRLRFDPPWRR